MKIKSTRQVSCIACRQKITLHEYEGLEGALYSDHHCAEERKRELESLMRLEQGVHKALGITGQSNGLIH